MERVATRVLIGMCIVFSLTSCDGDEAELVAVRGKVFYQGQPLVGGTIVFAPDLDRGGHGPLASAEIGRDGSYVLKTDERPGAVPGWHRVTIAMGKNDEGSTFTLPRQYMDPERSGQRWEVKRDRPNVIDIYLK